MNLSNTRGANAAGDAARLPTILALLVMLLAGCLSDDRPDVDSPDADTTGAMLELADATGHMMRRQAPASVVVSMAPNLTELIYAAGGGAKLAGRTSFCNYPPEVDSVPIVSDLQTPDYEQIIAIHPDVVLMTFAGNSRMVYDKFRNLGLEPFALEAASVDGVIAALDTIGMILGTADSATRMATRLRRRIDSIERLSGARPQVSVFMVIDQTPLVTVSRGFINDAITIAGGRNIAAGATQGYPQYSREELLRADPDVIIVPVIEGQTIESLLESYPEWKQLSAWRNDRIYAIPADIITRPTPRIVDGIEQLYRLLMDNG